VSVSRPVVITVSSVLAALVLIAAAILFRPTLVVLLSGHQTDKDERAGRALVAQRIDTYAAQVVAQSTGPAGPTPAELAALGDPDGHETSVEYAADRSGGALTALWVLGQTQVGNAFGPNNVIECYTIDFHDLGAPGATSKVTHLPDCHTVIARLRAQPPTPHPKVSSGN
jgi:hypothetical protein